MEKEQMQKETHGGLGNVIKLLRLANDMTIKDLASKMDVSAAYIGEIESNNKRPSLEMVSKFSTALNVKRSTIFYFDEEGKESNYDHKRLLLKILQAIVEN